MRVGIRTRDILINDSNKEIITEVISFTDMHNSSYELGPLSCSD